MRGLRTALALGLMLALLIVPGGNRSALADPPPAEILLGMSTALTGPTEQLGREMLQGVQAALKAANDRGGIQERNLKLIPLDDGYEPGRSAPNMRRLIDEEKVLAVIGNVGTPTAIAALPLVDERKTLLFAPLSGAGVLRQEPPNRYVINYRASYTEEIGAMIDALINHGGLKPEEIAFFTQRDGYGDSGLVGGLEALKRHGLRDENSIAHGRYARNSLAVENALADILLHDPMPRAVILVGAYAPCAKFIRLARESGLDALFLNVSFVGSTALAQALPAGSGEVLVTQVVPHPEDTRLPLVAEFRADLRRWAPDAQPTFVSLEGYLAARILLRALAALPGPPTREGIINALEGLGTFDLGLGAPLTLGPTEHQASHRIWPTRLENGTFVPFNWKNIAELLPRKFAP